MDMIWLEDFQALVRTGNFSRAAMLRNVTQPALSRRIRALEDWIGVALFDRQEQPVALTAAGRRFEPAAEEMLRRIVQTRADVQEAARHQTATLRFAATHVLSFTFFPTWFHQLEAGQPPATVHLVSDSLQACEQRMRLGHAHFLLCHYHPAAPNQLAGARFPSLNVGSDTLCLVGAPSLGATAESPPMLAYSHESGLGRIIAALCPPAAPGARAVFTSHLAAALRTLALDGRGLAWLPLSVVADDLKAGRLVRAATAVTDIPVEIRVFRHEARQDTAAETFWNALGAGRPVF